MGNKRKVCSLIAASLIAMSASAECFIRSATVTSAQRAVDVQERKFAYNGHRRCEVTMRVLVADEWQDADGEGEGETDAQACAVARADARLLLPDTATVNSESSMVCTDEPKVTLRERIRAGDWVKESEVAPFAGRTKPFLYQGVPCKWFLHKEAHLGKMVGFAGIICQSRPGQWQVIDLF